MTQASSAAINHYQGEHLKHIAFPLGGMGAGMFCVEGAGGINHMSIGHRPEMFFDPGVFASIHVVGTGQAKTVEGPVPAWKIFGPGSGGYGGCGGRFYGLPRFKDATFSSRFPFADIRLKEAGFPVEAAILAWSPFVPGNSRESGLPVAAMEYGFTNPTDKEIRVIFGVHAQQFLKPDSNRRVVGTEHGFRLERKPDEKDAVSDSSFTVEVRDADPRIDCAWFRGSQFDPITMLWKDIASGQVQERPPVAEGGPSPGASLYVQATLAPGGTLSVPVLFSWYTPTSGLHADQYDIHPEDDYARAHKDDVKKMFRPWYAEAFGDADAVSVAWHEAYPRLKRQTRLFTDTFYAMDLPGEIVEAVSANLSILKSPTILRQHDGRLWAWEGCGDAVGCCFGSCTHVWNYAQAICHLFPDLERTFRETEYAECLDDKGHQDFRAPLPIEAPPHTFHAAADGQLGSIIRMYRDWRIHGDNAWLASYWGRMVLCLDYCIRTWDPKERGVIEEPHHNTYDIEFWGADGMCTSMYLQALNGVRLAGQALGHDTARYQTLIERGREYLETCLYNGSWFFQEVKWEGLESADPVAMASKGLRLNYSSEAKALLESEGPKYQYGDGCLSDGIIGEWCGLMAGLDPVVSDDRIKSHLASIYRHNFKPSLADHTNPQRPGFALGDEGGLLLCSWPGKNEPALPVIYSNEVWSGIEYQVASHLLHYGLTREALDIVRACRKRFDGTVRNPYDEYECGHWYARALASYGLLQGISGIRYDKVDRTLTIAPKIRGDFSSFLATADGYGLAGVKGGEPFCEVRSGEIRIDHMDYTPWVGNDASS